MGVLSAVSHGGSYVLSSPAFSARKAVKAVEQERYKSAGEMFNTDPFVYKNQSIEL